MELRMSKKTTILGAILALCQVLAAQNFEIKITDNLSVGNCKAFECVALMAHLADFEEYNGNDQTGLIAVYDDYFKPFLKNKKVKKSISYFKKCKSFYGFSYDAVASLGTYLSPDCHSFRVSDEIVAEKIDQRCHNLKELLNAVSTFYDETDFGSFYESHYDIYEQISEIWILHKEDLINAIENVQKYYNVTTNKVFISSSALNYYGNYGMSFYDGENTFFEPKYCTGYYDDNLVIHELSHPYSNPVADKVFKNPEVNRYMTEQFKGERKKLMLQQAYGNAYINFIELINRANVIAILRNYNKNETAMNSINYDKARGFSEIQEVAEILELYRKGDYEFFMDFAPVLEEEFIKIIPDFQK